MAASNTSNTSVYFASRPVTAPVPNETFSVRTGPVPKPEAEGDVLLRTIYLALDPAMRGWMRDNTISYMKPLEIGELMRGLSLAEVVESLDPAYSPGDLVLAPTGWTEYAVLNPTKPNPVGASWVRVPCELPPGIKPIDYASVLGITGLTAACGVFECGKANEGTLGKDSTIVVSGAAGATGSTAAQIYKNVLGCRVVGIAGGKAKCKFLVDELGLDAAVDYKSPSFRADLAAACPNGIDEYYDNVEGLVTEAVFDNMARGCRVISCGGISNYNDEANTTGPRNYRLIRVKAATVKGFVVTYFAEKLADYHRQLVGWIGEGKIKNRCTVVPGMDKAPETFMMLFQGGNIGKLLVGAGKLEGV
ncbi:oxidoreductase, zinc-binding protein [Hyaloraphidium curvatum]|nr:oxidoreductase, zinc-binding protein [Hyaloraphidium curvatum]